MFIGSYQNSIDAKYRMIIPAKYRESLGLSCIATRGTDKCIYIYPVAEWQAFADKVRALPKTDPNARRYAREFFGNAEECEVDKQGRITIPQRLRDYAEIGKELLTIGDGEKIEVWSKDIYEADLCENKAELSDIAEKLACYGI